MIIIKIIEVDDLDFFPKLLLLLQFKEKYLIMCERIIIGWQFWLLLEEINKASLNVKEMGNFSMQSWWSNQYTICLLTIEL